jgi:hypothetical protein
MKKLHFDNLAEASGEVNPAVLGIFETRLSTVLSSLN